MKRKSSECCQIVLLCEDRLVKRSSQSSVALFPLCCCTVLLVPSLSTLVGPFPSISLHSLRLTLFLLHVQPKKGEAQLNRNTHFKLHIRIRSEFQRQRLLNQGLVVGPPFLTDLADSERIGVGQLAWSYRGSEGDLHSYITDPAEGNVADAKAEPQREVESRRPL